MKKLNNKTKVIALVIFSVFLIVLGIAFAYFQAIIDTEKSTRVDIISKTVDQFIITQGNPISIVLDHDNFAEGEGNITGHTTTKATLIANNKTNTATKDYFVYFYIGKNEFDYSSEEEIPEVILTIKDPSGNNITSIPGLTYITESDVSGFDITNIEEGVIKIAEDYTISTTSSTTGDEQEWEAIVTVRNLDFMQTNLVGNKMRAQLIISSEEKTGFSFGDLILANNGGKEIIDIKDDPDFAGVETENKGIYKMEDDYGDSYYFRGAVDNNWIKFGKEGNNDIWWRIVRINGDGSIKLIYSGITGPRNSGESVVLTTEDVQIRVNDTRISEFNSESGRGEYLGYKFELNKARGYANNSTIKSFIDDWYVEHMLNTDYEEYLEDFIVCNDRGFIIDDWEPIGTAIPAKNSDVNNRLDKITPISPMLTCAEKEDAYTKEDLEKGNGKLDYKVGLLTADEVVLAGGRAGMSNSSYYLYSSRNYWLVSPSSAGLYGVNMYSVSATGGVSQDFTSLAKRARSVISISTGVLVSGSGHWDDPYVIE